jgi:hypothetical protein
VRKPHEHPSISALLCASKNDEVVEYALSRTLSPETGDRQDDYLHIHGS